MALKKGKTTEKKFVTRQEHEIDTRAKTIRLTNIGETVLQKAIIEIENADIVFFASLDIKLVQFNKNMVQLIDRNKTE